jgi:two-component system, cell cycle sensor histidine kinase and response regulator CckA
MSPVLKKIINYPYLLFSAYLLMFIAASAPVPAADAILAGAEIAYPPYSIVNAHGQADGFAVELLRETLHIMGSEVRFRTDTWDTVKQALEAGEVEVLPLVGRTPERENIFDFTFPYLTMHGTILVHEDTRSINTLEDLAAKKVAVMRSDNSEEFSRRTLLQSEIIAVETFPEALAMLSEKTVDAVLIQRLVAIELMRQLNITTLRMTGPPLMDFSQTFCFAVSEGNSSLLAMLNEGLSTIIANGTYNTLYTKWFGPPLTTGNRYSRIIVGGDNAYPPYEFIDENGQPAGFNIDLTRAIAEEIGADVEIVLDAWAKTYSRLLNNEIDLIQGVFYSLARDEFLDFSQPHTVVSHVIVTRTGEHKELSTLEDLKGLQILVMEQDIMHNRAVEAGLESYLIPTVNQETALRLLAGGTGDCVLAAEMPAQYWIETNGWSNLEIGERVLSPEYCFAALDASPEPTLMEFSEALAALKANGTYKEIYTRWFSVYEQQQQPSTIDILKTFAYVFIPILLIILLISLWSIMLRKKVTERTAELQETTEKLQEEVIHTQQAERKIRESEAKFREYVENSPNAVFVCDEKGDYIEINSAAEKMTGYDKSELLAMNVRDFAVDGDEQPVIQASRKILRNGRDTRVLRYRRKDGSCGYWTLNAVALSQNRFLGFTVDVTPLVEAQQLNLAEKERLNVTLRSIGDGVITTDNDGRVLIINQAAEKLTGWSQSEAQGKLLSEVFHIINEQTGQLCENPVDKVLQQGVIVELANHTVLISKSGERFAIADSGAPIRSQEGDIIGVVLVFRDQTEEKRSQRQTQIRLNLLEYASSHSLEDLLQKALDEICELTSSPIGFYHLVDSDQKTLLKQQWSTATLNRYCRTGEGSIHYDIDQAGVWGDCIRAARPVIHNDYASLLHKKPLPEGHPELTRELVVPVMRNGKAVAILGLGNKASDYTDRNVETAAYLADVTWELLEHKRFEEQLKHNHYLMSYVIEHSQSAIAVHDKDLNYIYVSQQYLNSYNVAEQDIIGRHHYEVFPDLPQKWRDVHQKALMGEVSSAEDDPYIHEDGTVDWTRWECRPWYELDGTIGGLIVYTEVINERKRQEEEQKKLQAQLFQARKMESIGRLAGGVAHDYNNMLSVIRGYTEMALEKTAPSTALHSDLEEIMKAADRSVDITRQLLAFSRKQAITPRVLDLNTAVEKMLNMLCKLIGEDIELIWIPDDSPGLVCIDPSQIDQILANLCVNARDAISGVGKITIEVSKVDISEEYGGMDAGRSMNDGSIYGDCLPGRYSRLTISDTGSGMDKETLEMLFEPFFTTKRPGEGTGLGLATVYGIIKQNDGFIQVFSELGSGTVFTVHLPSAEGEISPAVQYERSLPAAMGQGELILLAEDEPEIRKLTRTMLESLNYRVIDEETPEEAIQKAREYHEHITLLITDVVMPEMNGRELAQKITDIIPGIQILYISGYTADVIVRRGVLDGEVNFLQKPFTKPDLAMMVSETLRGHSQ